jgi:aspartate/methionine/tyrosine aminotransferase
MRIKEFSVERWMDRYETTCRYNLAETCVESLTVGELLDIAGKTDTVLSELRPLKLTYGAIPGSARLRRNIASLHSSQGPENVVITHGAIGGNALIYQTLVEPGDRVISVLPTYQQHHSIPESLGAEVCPLRLREENQFLPDLDELRRLVNGRSRIIAINNPNNPTGSLMDQALLQEITEIAATSGAWVLSDEVYRGIDQDADGFTASVADLYERGISTGSMSKVFSLAGLRLGWIVGPPTLLRAVTTHRDYNTISVGMLDDFFASLALEHRDAILARSRRIVKTNLEVLDQWVRNESTISYVKPRSGSTALLRYQAPLDSVEFCTRLIDSTGVMLTPGSALDIEGYVRIGYANNRSVLEAGLARMSDFLASIAELSAQPQAG